MCGCCCCGGAAELLPKISSAASGTAVGKDDDAGKATLVAVLGIERARAHATMLAEQAAAHLDHFGENADLLKALARYMVTRRN